MYVLLFMFASLTWSNYAEVRPGYTTGYGAVIDDLERHTSAGHPMRNEKDPGNWAHELVHQVNSDLRNVGDNCFYVGGGRYMRLQEPNIKLADVANEVTERGPLYQLYLVERRRGWNNYPLYVLDEACAYATGLKYHVETGTKNEHRLKSAQEFLHYSAALVKAVEKHDSDYLQLGELRAFVAWQANWVNDLTREYNGETVEPEIPNEFIFNP